MNYPRVTASDNQLDRGVCSIDGEEYALAIGKMVNFMRDGMQPRVLILADPGYGKTFASGRLGEILHHELGICEGEFKPGNQMFGDPLDFIKASRVKERRALIVPDADNKFPGKEWQSPKNRANADVMDLTRLFGPVLVYDAHEMAACDKAIRTKHNIRMTPTGSNNHQFKVERIYRKKDSRREQEEKRDLGTWKPDKPSKTTIERITQLDEHEKERHIKEREEQIEMRREKEEMRNISFG